MRAQPRKPLKKYTQMTKSVSGRYRLRLVESGSVGSEMPLNTGGWTRRTRTPCGRPDLYIRRVK